MVYVVEGYGGHAAVWSDDGGQASLGSWFILLRGVVAMLEGKILHDFCLCCLRVRW